MSSKGATPPPTGAVGASATTAGLPAAPLQSQAAQSAYTPMPKPGANYGQTMPAYEQQAQAAAQQPAASPTPAAPTNPNESALAPQGANLQGDVWAPGTGPSGGYNGYGGANGWGGTGGGKASKGGVPPGMPGAGAGAGAGSSVGPSGGAPTSSQQPGGAGAFGGQYDAIKNKLGLDAAQTFAVQNWGSGGKQALEQMYGGDTDAYNAAINAHGAGGVGTGIQGRTIIGPGGQRYQVGEQGRVRGPGGGKATRALYQDQAWLDKNAVKL